MSKIQETYELGNGTKIPKVGFGTWQIPNGEVTYNSVTYALKNGYRHIDTANGYGNEESVGKAIKDSGLERSEVFVTTKLPAEIKTYEGALKSFEETMENLGLEYVDLYLIHAPWPWSEIGKDCTEENIKVWKAMEEIYESGRAKAIGVSNFNVADLTAILDNATVKPMANQIRFYIGDTQDEITDFCKENGILVEGYSPLATGRMLKNGEVAKLAEKYNASVPQICIRYVIQKGVLPLPKSTHEEYIISNSKVDFEISEEDMNYLDNLKNTVE